MQAQENSQARKNWAAPFFTVWTGQAVSLLGSQLVQFALIWWLTKTTGSATVLATASLAGMLPQVFLGPFSGVLVDRWKRRTIMILADSAIALATVVLAVLFWRGAVQIWQVYALIFFRSAATGFHAPAMQASTSLMVPKQHLSRVQGINQMLNGGLNVLSAPLGALLLEVLPLQGVLGIDVATAILAISPLFFIDIPQPAPRRAADGSEAQSSFWEDLQAGMRYVWGWPGLVVLILMATLINFVISPAFALLPILVTQHFGGQAIQLAWFEAIMSVGVILGGLTLGVWGGFERRILTSMLGLFGLGLGSMALGLVPASGFNLGLGVLFIAGFSLSITNGPILAVVQSIVSPEMQGRVFTLIGSAATAVSPIGLIVAGPVADWLGVQSWYVLGGVVTLLMAVAGLFSPAVMGIEDNRDVRTEVQDETGAAFSDEVVKLG